MNNEQSSETSPLLLPLPFPFPFPLPFPLPLPLLLLLLMLLVLVLVLVLVLLLPLILERQSNVLDADTLEGMYNVFLYLWAMFLYLF